jgi:hypothetical protein
MQTIHLIDNIFIENGVLQTYGREGKETMVFLKRGDLVGKCAVYSLMMMLILHKRINREDLLSKVNYEAPPYLKELKKQFLLRTKIGYSMRSLRDKLLLSFNNHIRVDVFSIINFIEDDLRKLHFMIKEQLDAEWPVQIGFSFPQGKEVHSVVAVGYTMYGRILRLFCLDPAFDLGCASMWNNIIDINMDYDNLLKLDFNHNVDVAVHVNSILLINEKQDLPFKPEEKDSFLPF